MRRPIRPKQHDFFAAPASGPLSLPAVLRLELVRSLSVLLLEVMSTRRSQRRGAQQEPGHEYQDHA